MLHLTVTRVIAKLDRGGAQLSMLRVARHLASRGVRTRLLAGYATDEGVALARDHGLEAEVYGRAGDLQWTPDDGFAAWLEQRLDGADLVHAHMFGAWWAAVRAAPSALPVIASEHNAYHWPGEDHGDALASALPGLACFFAHGPGARATVVEAGLPPDRVLTGISPVTGMDARPRLGLSAGRVVFSGRLDPDKAPDVLMAAVPLLRGRPPVLMLGAGRLEPALREQRARLGLEQQVEMPGWASDPAPLIAGAAVLAIPSRDESFSQTAVLGMGLGVPVIGTDVDGFPATLGDGRGIVVAPDDPVALARAIQDVLDGRARVDLAGARRFAQQFEIGRVARVYKRTYRALVDRAALAA